MPRVDIWIRKQDWGKWTAIEDKPRWIHDALQGTAKEYPKAVKERKQIEKLILGKELDYSTDREWTGPLMRDKKKGKL